MDDRTVLVLNGPNLNLLGEREPEVYGTDTLDDIVEGLRAHVADRPVEVRSVQSNHEGVLVDALHEARGWADGVVLNAGSLTHTSYALRDAISACELPVVSTDVGNVGTMLEGLACARDLPAFSADAAVRAIDAVRAAAPEARSELRRSLAERGLDADSAARCLLDLYRFVLEGAHGRRPAASTYAPSPGSGPGAR